MHLNIWDFVWKLGMLCSYVFWWMWMCNIFLNELWECVYGDEALKMFEWKFWACFWFWMKYYNMKNENWENARLNVCVTENEFICVFKRGESDFWDSESL